MITGILTAGFGLLVLVGVPFVIAIAAVTIGAMTAADMEPAFFAQQLIAGSQSFSLLAIPLFMLAGELMTAGGMSQRLIDVANTLVRHRTGGLAMVAVVSSLVFAAISGSAPATTAAIGA
jgi:TRAP-type mannitol/chloroaromatic compound transport system permease large subunit